MRPHHLQLAAYEPTTQKPIREQQSQFVAAAEPRAVGRPSLAAGGEFGRRHMRDRALEMECHAELCGKPRGQIRDDFPRIDAHLAWAEECKLKSLYFEGRRTLNCLARTENLDRFTMVVALTSEFSQDLRFVIAISHVQRASGFMPDVGLAQQVVPDFQAPRSHVAYRTEWLADWPEHSEIPNRGPLRAGMALEHSDPTASPGQLVSMGKSQDSGADHGVVVSGEWRH
jgi:hypothetical protein